MTRHAITIAAAIGQAVGDALGYQVERQGPEACRAHARSWLYGDRSSEPGRGGHRTGQVSDDTQMALAVMRSLSSPVDQEEALAAELCAMRADVVGGGKTSLSMLAALEPLLPGRDLDEALAIRDAGAGPQRASNGAAMRSWPYAFLPLRDSALCAKVRRAARITHRNPDSAAGAVVAAALTRAVLVDPSDPVGGALAVVRGDASAVRMIEAAASVGALPDDLARAATWAMGGSDEAWRDVSPSPNATLAWALRAYLKGAGDFRATVFHALAAGGDVDTVAGLAGAWCAIASGAAAIPPELSAIPTDRGRWGGSEIVQVAARFSEAL